VDGPKLEEVRTMKAKLLERLKGRADFAGAGIGQEDGKLVIQVNWRKLPADVAPLRRIGNVEIRHQEVGTVYRQTDKSPRE
jgi:hypothetical protein